MYARIEQKKVTICNTNDKDQSLKYEQSFS